MVEIKSVPIKLQVPLKDLAKALALRGERSRWFAKAEGIVVGIQVVKFAKFVDLEKPAIYKKLGEYTYGEKPAIVIQSDKLYLKPREDWDDSQIAETLKKWKDIIEAVVPAAGEKSSPD